MIEYRVAAAMTLEPYGDTRVLSVTETAAEQMSMFEVKK